MARARAEGSAVGLGHPYDATLSVLERELPRLELRGVKLVPVGDLAR
ncbi:MAG TPA: divergent polysaccharide deacetylase family protein [Thermoanaerobaculia bacterium]|nr:divergent polysaccharide deacetylase family protein [Thermoanaerobaculia bacterium]